MIHDKYIDHWIFEGELVIRLLACNLIKTIVQKYKQEDQHYENSSYILPLKLGWT